MPPTTEPEEPATSYPNGISIAHLGATGNQDEAFRGYTRAILNGWSGGSAYDLFDQFVFQEI